MSTSRLRHPSLAKIKLMPFPTSILYIVYCIKRNTEYRIQNTEYMPRRQEGQVLVIVLIFMAVLMIISAAGFSRVTNFLNFSNRANSRDSATVAAEAGIDYALWKLNTVSGYAMDSGHDSNYSDAERAVILNLPDSQVAVYIADSGADKVITSTGYIPNKTNPQAKQTIQISSKLSTTGGIIPLSNAIQADTGGISLGATYLRNTSNTPANPIPANAFANSSIDGTAPSGGIKGKICGSAYVSGSISTTPITNLDYLCNSPDTLPDPAKAFYDQGTVLLPDVNKDSIKTYACNANENGNENWRTDYTTCARYTDTNCTITVESGKTKRIGYHSTENPTWDPVNGLYGKSIFDCGLIITCTGPGGTLLIESDIWLPNDGMIMTQGCGPIRPDGVVFNQDNNLAPHILLKGSFTSTSAQMLADTSNNTQFTHIISEVSVGQGISLTGSSEIRAVLMCPTCTINITGAGGGANVTVTALYAKRIAATCTSCDAGYNTIAFREGLKIGQCLAAGCTGTGSWQLKKGTYQYLTSPASAYLVGWWKFDGNTNDSSGNNFNASKYINWTSDIYTPGKIGQALNIDNSNEYVCYQGDTTCPNSPDNPLLRPSNTNQITVSAWIKRNGLSAGNSTIVYKGPLLGGKNSFQMYIKDSDNKLRFGIWHDPPPLQYGDWDNAISTQAITDTTTWHHIVGTYDGTNVCIYIDTDQNPDCTPRTGTLSNDTGILRIGVWSQWFAYNGLIDDVRIYNKALKPSEIN